ncbi:MAG: hypothetical protein JNK63_11740 [Chthonomonas sp.]|nr:hypothetical protein [Chthonomonas sp.]
MTWADIPAWVPVAGTAAILIGHIAVSKYKLGEQEKKISELEKRQAAHETHVEALVAAERTHADAIVNSERASVNNKLDALITEVGNLKVEMTKVATRLEERTGSRT